ncbi:MAG: alpha/beta hydrolase [Actinomycetota bacterium]|nr:alpha/beta hydrolase [Actinomycetota bacterium]
MPVMLTHDTSIDYDVHGDGPFLLLINGLGFGRWAWFKQVPTLSRHFRTITFDIRGEHSLSHGVADLCAEVVALLDHLGVEKTHVLGTSLGGFVAQKLALERPDLVDRLVLVCTSYGAREPQPMSFQALGKMLGGGSLSPESAARQGLEGATSDSYRAEHPEEFDLILRWRLADSSSLSDYYQQMIAGTSFDAAFAVRNIASPTLVIHGTEDRYVPIANAAALVEAIPDARLRVVDGAGHLVFIEQAEEVNEESISFFESYERKPSWRLPVEQKMKKLIRQAGEANGKILSVFNLRDSQAPYGTRETQAAQEAPEKERLTLAKLRGWLRRPFQATGAWTKKLRDRLSR